MESLVRIAEHKYFKSKVCSTLAESVRFFLEKHCLAAFK